MKSQRIANFERVAYHAPDALVAEVLRTHSFERQWPKYRSLQQVAMHLARYTLDILPTPTVERPLLVTILEQACSAAEAMSRTVTKDRDRLVQRAFVTQTVRHLHCILATRVRVQVGSHTVEWDPFVEPLWALRERYPYNHLRPEAVPAFPLDEETARIYMAARIIPMSLVATLGHPLLSFMPTGSEPT